MINPIFWTFVQISFLTFLAGSIFVWCMERRAKNKRQALHYIHNFVNTCNAGGTDTTHEEFWYVSALFQKYAIVRQDWVDASLPEYKQYELHKLVSDTLRARIHRAQDAHMELLKTVHRDSVPAKKSEQMINDLYSVLEGHERWKEPFLQPMEKIPVGQPLHGT